MNIQSLFKLGMKREISAPLEMLPGAHLNLGCGNSKIPGAINLDYPEWDAENYLIEVSAAEREKMGGRSCVPGMEDIRVRCPSDSVTGIHAYHFLEHISDPRRMLKEMQRVLVVGGVVNIVVPHYSCSMAHHDLDHKHTFALDTWDNTFSTNYYLKGHEGWKFRVHLNILIAVAERNTAILTQLVKVE